MNQKNSVITCAMSIKVIPSKDAINGAHVLNPSSTQSGWSDIEKPVFVGWQQSVAIPCAHLAPTLIQRLRWFISGLLLFASYSSELAKLEFRFLLTLLCVERW